jgi:hypothetical protein
MLHGLGIETDVDLNQIVEIAAFICGKLDRTVPSSVGKALSISKL